MVLKSILLSCMLGLGFESKQIYCKIPKIGLPNKYFSKQQPNIQLQQPHRVLLSHGCETLLYVNTTHKDSQVNVQ